MKWYQRNSVIMACGALVTALISLAAIAWEVDGETVGALSAVAVAMLGIWKAIAMPAQKADKESKTTKPHLVGVVLLCALMGACTPAARTAFAHDALRFTASAAVCAMNCPADDRKACQLGCAAKHGTAVALELWGVLMNALDEKAVNTVRSSLLIEED